MAIRQYIGARYVTKIYENSLDPSTAEWESGFAYEPLTLVTYNNSSYLSKKEVPANIGSPDLNPTYWVITGAYNGQILQLQNDVATNRHDIATNAGNITLLQNNLNGKIRVIKSTFDTTLPSGRLSRVINDADFQALGITPENSFIIGYNAYNHLSTDYWANDTYPADYVHILESTKTISVTNLASGASQLFQFPDYDNLYIMGIHTSWASTGGELMPEYVFKDNGTFYIKVTNNYSTALTDTGTVKVMYEYYPANENVKGNPIKVIDAKLRYSSGVPTLQVETVLPAQYQIGDEFQIAIYTCDNVLDFT